MDEVVLTSRWIADRHCNAIMAAIPGCRVVAIDTGERLDAAEIATITVAYFSADVWRSGSNSLMRIALDAPELRWMHVFNAGTDHPVFAMLRQRGVRLTTSSGSSATAIAHTVMMQILNLVRDNPRWWREQRAHDWRPRDVADVEGRTLGIVGLGSIGTAVARLGAAFEMSVVAIRRTPTGAEPCPAWPVERLDELLGIVDDLVLCAPLTPDTTGLIDARRLGLLRPGAHVINVGRGELIDEQALIEALRSGHVGGAALDVFATEPLPVDSPLWEMSTVLVTPHSAGGTT
jgi:D-2-hydroxyacid dehydrogenase (NADP+)